jgi:hypothetical protein
LSLLSLPSSKLPSHTVLLKSPVFADFCKGNWMATHSERDSTPQNPANQLKQIDLRALRGGLCHPEE